MSATNRAELLAKIRKCLALAKSANEHEAAAALAKARELMDAYGVDQADVDQSAVGEDISPGSLSQKPTMWETALVFAVVRAIPVKAFLDGAGWRFVGITPAPEIAAYAFTALFRQLRAARRVYIATNLKRCGPKAKTRRADHFCEGWVTAVYNQIARLYPERELDALVTAYLARRFPGLAKFEPREAKAGGRQAENDYWNGRDRGREARLHHGVAGAAPAPQLR